MEFLVVFVLVSWISGAIGAWIYIAEQDDKPLKWVHLLVAFMSLYWPVFVPGIVVYRMMKTLPDDKDDKDDT